MRLMLWIIGQFCKWKKVHSMHVTYNVITYPLRATIVTIEHGDHSIAKVYRYGY